MGGKKLPNVTFALVVALVVTACDENGLRLGWFADPEPTPTPAIVDEPSESGTSAPPEVPAIGTEADQSPNSDSDSESDPVTEPDSDADSDADSDSESEAEAEAEQQRLITLINNLRAERGVPLLQLNSILSGAAQAHAKRMAEEEFFSAVDPDGVPPDERIRREGYEWHEWGEILATGYNSAEEVFKAWVAHPVHRANLLRENFTEFGLGYAVGRSSDTGKRQQYWVQNFGAPRGRVP